MVVSLAVVLQRRLLKSNKNNSFWDRKLGRTALSVSRGELLRTPFVLEALFAMFQSFNPLFQRWMRRKQIIKEAFSKRIIDIHSLRCNILALHWRSLRLQFLQSVNHPLRILRNAYRRGSNPRCRILSASGPVFPNLSSSW